MNFDIVRSQFFRVIKEQFPKKKRNKIKGCLCAKSAVSDRFSVEFFFTDALFLFIGSFVFSRFLFCVGQVHQDRLGAGGKLERSYPREDPHDRNHQVPLQQEKRDSSSEIGNKQLNGVRS